MKFELSLDTLPSPPHGLEKSESWRFVRHPEVRTTLPSIEKVSLPNDQRRQGLMQKHEALFGYQRAGAGASSSHRRVGTPLHSILLIGQNHLHSILKSLAQRVKAKTIKLGTFFWPLHHKTAVSSSSLSQFSLCLLFSDFWSLLQEVRDFPAPRYFNLVSSWDAYLRATVVLCILNPNWT